MGFIAGAPHAAMFVGFQWQLNERAPSTVLVSLIATLLLVTIGTYVGYTAAIRVFEARAGD
jgi:hypothetical protein